MAKGKFLLGRKKKSKKRRGGEEERRWFVTVKDRTRCKNFEGEVRQRCSVISFQTTPKKGGKARPYRREKSQLLRTKYNQPEGIGSQGKT